MDSIFLENGHLSAEGLRALQAGRLDEQQRLEAAEHLAFCAACMERYTEQLTQPLSAPETVLPAVQKRVRAAAWRQQLQRWSLVAAGAVLALALWGNGRLMQVMDSARPTPDTAPTPSSSWGLQAQDSLNAFFSHPQQWLAQQSANKTEQTTALASEPNKAPQHT